MDDKFEAKPTTQPVDYKKLREDIYKRFSKSFDKLAKN